MCCLLPSSVRRCATKTHTCLRNRETCQFKVHTGEFFQFFWMLSFVFSVVMVVYACKSSCLPSQSIALKSNANFGSEKEWNGYGYVQLQPVQKTKRKNDGLTKGPTTAKIPPSHQCSKFSPVQSKLKVQYNSNNNNNPLARVTVKITVAIYQTYPQRKRPISSFAQGEKERSETIQTTCEETGLLVVQFDPVQSRFGIAKQLHLARSLSMEQFPIFFFFL
jgi:hypothetical protein